MTAQPIFRRHNCPSRDISFALYPLCSPHWASLAPLDWARATTMKKYVPYRGAQFTISRFSVDNGIVQHTSRWRMYRAYLQLLRLIPDPHLWAMLYPEMRNLCAYKPPPESVLPREPDNSGTVAEIEARYVLWRKQVRDHAAADLLREKQLLETRGVSGSEQKSMLVF